MTTNIDVHGAKRITLKQREFGSFRTYEFAVETDEGAVTLTAFSHERIAIGITSEAISLAPALNDLEVAP